MSDWHECPSPARRRTSWDWLWPDLSAAIRSYRKRPAVASIAIVTLAIGIGVNVAALAVAYAVLGRPLPYAEPSRLVVFDLLFSDGGPLGFSPSVAPEWLERLHTVESAAAYGRREVTVRAGAHTTVVPAALVTPAFFTVLGVTPTAGGNSIPTDEAQVVVSGRALPQLGLETLNVGSTALAISDQSYAVSGVMPRAFAFPDEQVSVWLPSRPQALGYSRIVARLKPGVTLQQARADADRVRRELNPHSTDVVAVNSLGDVRVGGLRRLLVATVIGGGLVLLVACANIATLLLGRDLARQREFATRLALGASARQLSRLVFVDTALLAAVAALVAVGVAGAALTVFTTQAAAVIPGLSGSLALPVVAATTGLTLAATLSCGGFLAWHTVRLGDVPLLRAGAATPRSWRTRQALVVSQIAFCVVLLVGAGLLMRTMVTLIEEDHGFDPVGAIEAKIVLRDMPFPNDGLTRDGVVPALVERVSGLPGVRRVGFGTSLPPRPPLMTIGVSVRGATTEAVRMMNIAWASPGYLPALGARFVAGRDLGTRDATDAAPGVVLSESAARGLFPGQDPLGRVIPDLPSMLRAARGSRVVGVVSDIQYDGLDSPPGSTIYLPWGRRPIGRGYLVARGDAGTSSLAPAVRRIAGELDATVAVTEAQSLEDVLAESVGDRRLRTIPAVVFGGIALAVALVGLIAALSTAIAERQRDLAIRAALGATGSTLFASVVGAGVRLTALGVVIGLTAAATVTRGLSSLLYRVSPYDAVSFVGAAALVIAGATFVSCIAAWPTRTIEQRLMILKE